MWTLAGDNSVIPGVAFLTSLGPTNDPQRFARPAFRLVTLWYAGSRQAGFCPCTPRRSSDPAEPTFGRPRYFFEGVAPHPNCPPAVVPFRVRTTTSEGWCSIGGSTPPGEDVSLPPTYALHPKPWSSGRLQ